MSNQNDLHTAFQSSDVGFHKKLSHKNDPSAKEPPAASSLSSSSQSNDDDSSSSSSDQSSSDSTSVEILGIKPPSAECSSKGNGNQLHSPGHDRKIIGSPPTNKSNKNRSDETLIGFEFAIDSVSSPSHSRKSLTETRKAVLGESRPKEDPGTSRQLPTATEGGKSLDRTTIAPLCGRQRTTEIDPLLYAPLPFSEKSKPTVRHLTLHNRPIHMRKKLPTNHFFDAPISRLWLGKFDTFNHLQSELAQLLAQTNENVVVSAPTGAGKTALFEMAMARQIGIDLTVSQHHEPGVTAQLPKHRKMVYVSPSKALCEERYEDWARRLGQLRLGIQCAMITGDAEPTDCFRQMAEAHLVLTTPEKFDSLTRRWTEQVFLVASIKLLLIDEAHLLGDASRGCCLESIICRMKTVYRATQNLHASPQQILGSSYPLTTPDAIASDLRVVAVSATLPNIEDIAGFLDARETHAFDDSFRPVPLTTHVVGAALKGKNEYLFNKSLNSLVPGLIKQFSNGKPTLVFCHTKKECEELAQQLSNVPGVGRQRDENLALAGTTRVPGLQRTIPKSVAYHHAGLEAQDRKLVEQAFSEGRILCLCATSTLAMGVNLPASLVVIKGTRTWRGTNMGHQEIDTGKLLQMIGRSGRPGFDSRGTAIIMTDTASKPRYQKLSGGLDVVESRLPDKIIQVFNTEISQRVVTSLQTGIDWIASTFFFARACRNPAFYNLTGLGQVSTQQWLEKITVASLKQLKGAGLIDLTEDRDSVVTPLAGCFVMSQHMVDFEAMKTIVNLPFDVTQERMLHTLSEFDGLHRPCRRNEKKQLNAAHATIRYKLDGPPSKVRIQTPMQKAYVLLQAAIGQHEFKEYTLRQEMTSMVEYASRMLSAIEEYSIEGSRNCQVALRSLLLRRSFETSLWNAKDGVLNQLRGVGAQTTRALRMNGILSFDHVISATEGDLEKAACRTAPFGKQIKEVVAKLMENTLRLSARVDHDSRDSSQVICRLSKRAGGDFPFLSDTKEDDSDLVQYTLIAFTDKEGGGLTFKPQIRRSGEYTFACPKRFGAIYVHLISNFVGLDGKVITPFGLFVVNEAHSLLLSSPLLD